MLNLLRGVRMTFHLGTQVAVPRASCVVAEAGHSGDRLIGCSCTDLTSHRGMWKLRRMRLAARLVALVTVMTLLLPSTGMAVRARVHLHRLRMDGYVGAPPEGRRERADLLLRVGSKDVRFQVTAATVLSGDILAARIFDRVRPYRPNFILRAPPAVLAPIEGATPGARFRILGGWRPGSRDLLVSSIETLSPAADAPAAP